MIRVICGGVVPGLKDHSITAVRLKLAKNVAGEVSSLREYLLKAGVCQLAARIADGFYRSIQRFGVVTRDAAPDFDKFFYRLRGDC
jgi:hypothetical protein